MVEADRHLKLLPTSILDIDKVFEHIDMLSISIQHQPYTVIPTLFGSDFGVLGHCCKPPRYVPYKGTYVLTMALMVRLTKVRR